MNNKLTSLEQQALEKFFTEERELMATEGYEVSKEATLRKVALNVILKVSAYDFCVVRKKLKRKEITNLLCICSCCCSCPAYDGSKPGSTSRSKTPTEAMYL